MDAEKLKSLIKELFISGEIKVKIDEECEPYIGEGVAVSVEIDEEVVCKSYVRLKDTSQND